VLAKHASGRHEYTKKAPQGALFGLMTQVGQNWNQLVVELAGWHKFGKDLQVK
jgi:hypothetical protein